MVRESPNWRPTKWSESYTRRKRAHVLKVALLELNILVGPHTGNLLYAEFVAAIKSELGRAEIHRRGYLTMGEVSHVGHKRL